MLSSATLLIALFAGVLIAFTVRLSAVAGTHSKILEATLETKRVVERAYVSISHQRPGLRADYDWVSEVKNSRADDSPEGDFEVSVRVRNCGNTPATITRVVLRHLVAAPPLADEPPYGDCGDSKAVKAHLGKSDHGTVPYRFSLPNADFESIRSGKSLKLWIFGYVDYIDAFGKHYRTGYARRYESILDESENNLVLETKPGYNYDRERKRGDGGDWS